MCVLLAGKGSSECRNVLLEFKESRPSAYDVYRNRETGPEALAARAERVVGGAARLAGGVQPAPRLRGRRRPCRFRCARSARNDGRVDLKSLKTPALFESVVRVQAAILARTHGRAAAAPSGRRIPLAELADAEAFCQRVLSFALGYADLVRRDWTRFVGRAATWRMLAAGGNDAQTVPRTRPSMTVLLSVQGLTKSFGPRPLFTDLSLDLRAGERLGLIGPNGSGKSTLLKLLAGREEPDAGTRSLRRATRLGYLAQDDVFAPGQTVRDVLLAALADEPIEEHERETRAAITLTQVGFTDPEQPADVLSGGWRKRLALARELVRRPDLLLLDEPTNHLDLPGIVWLERLLRAAPFGYVVATHDRAFLRAVADEVIEISRVYPGGFFRAPGSYDQFVERRDEFLEGQARQQESVANQVRRETEWLGRKESAQTQQGRPRASRTPPGGARSWRS